MPTATLLAARDQLITFEQRLKHLSDIARHAPEAETAGIISSQEASELLTGLLGEMAAILHKTNDAMDRIVAEQRLSIHKNGSRRKVATHKQ